MRIGTLLALIVTFCWLPAAQSKPQTAGDLFRDKVTLKNGKQIEGRVLQRYHPDHVVLYRKTNQEEIPHKEIKEIRTLRDDLETFMAGHQEGLTLAQEWRRVQEAIGLNLKQMARVQAWKVLTIDPQHGPANEFLGHKAVRGKYGWQLGRKKYTPEDFKERISDWRNRFVLQSEHYTLETDTSVVRAVQVLYDLEAVYLQWMQRFGKDLQLGEDVYLANHRMTMYVFENKDDRGFSHALNSRREPFYDPSSSTTTSRTANPNLAFTYYRGRVGDRPVDFFNVAVQQVMYSTLVLPHRNSFVPANEYTTPAHWVEVGMGYWFGRQFGGAPGYTKPQRFVSDSRNRELASRRMRSGPLSSGSSRREVTNLVNLERRYYYNVSKDNTNELYRAKARSFFRYLMEEDPPLVLNNKVVGRGREGILRYLREVYVHPTNHSSKSFDNAMGGKVELLFEGWLGWRK
jgi:hypothetical protein